MSFRFKLESLLSLKRNIEDQSQLKLARQQIILNNHRLRLAGLEKDRQELIVKVEEGKKKTMSGPKFLFYMESMRLLELRIQILKNTIAAQKNVLETFRKALADAVQERKTIEVLRENQLQKYLLQARRKEQNESDEQALLRHGRGFGY